MRAAMTLALIVTCATAWAQNPNLAEYEFTTGQDASKWITLSGNATQMIASGLDDTNSDFTNIGFDFPFGDGTYTQFWTSSNGILSFNSEQAPNWQWQFHSERDQYKANQPKICGISRDMSTGTNGYVKYEVTGTTPNRVLVCEFFLYGDGGYTNYDANIKWQVQLHEANAKVVMIYGDALNTDLGSIQIGLSQSESDIWTINPSTHEAIHSTGAVTATYETWPGANRYYEFNPPAPEDFSDNGDGTYTINTAAGWGLFCDAIEDGESFSGKTVYLGADITITRMANNADPCFRGTFDGQGHTLTLDYGTATNPVDAQFVAPFVMTYWNTSPTFRNLTIDGHIYSTCTANVDGKNTGGLIGHLYGDVTIEHCTSNVEIINSSGGAGGFVGLCEHTVNFNDCMSSNVIHSAGGNNSGFVSWSRASGYQINFTGCVFNGKLLQINGEGHSNGGFIGWTGSNKTVSITNCLYAPAALAEGEAYASYNSATFARGWNATTTATNSYYTTDFNDGTHYTGQGTQAYSISADQNVTVENAGTATTYATSGITSYGTGIKYNNVLYAGSGDAVSLTLNHSEAPSGYTFNGYTASAGTLNGTTLTMPNENVIISATMTPNSYTVQFNGNGNTGGSMSDQPFTYDVAQNLTANAFTLTNYTFAGWNTQANGGGTSYTDGQEVINLTATNNGTVTLYAQWTLAVVPVTYLDMNGTPQQCNSYILLTGIITNNYLAAGWYVADGNVTFNSTININGNVHLILKDGAVMNVGTEQGYINDKGISISNSSKSLSIYAQSTGADKGQLNVYATKQGINAEQSASVNINGGQVTATGGKYGIYAYSYATITIRSGQVTATGSIGIYANVNGSVNINGGQVTATGNDYGISASQQSALTISGGQVTATGAGTNGKGILSDNSTVNISGGQVTANGTSRGISVYNFNNGTFTLGWTNPTDYIYANSYYAAPTINIAEGKAFIDDDGNTYTSGALTSEQLEAIAGKKLYPYVEGSIPYIDENGQRQLRLAGEYTTLTGNETTLGTAGQETWYVAQGTLNYSSTITLSGNTHIILCDGAVMNVDVTSTNTSSGIYSASSGYSLSIYGQTNQSGELNVTSTNDYDALYVYGDITIAGGKVTASGKNGIMANGGNVTIKNATVAATGTLSHTGMGICSYNGGITIDNSNVTATGTDIGGNGKAIYTFGGDITIGNSNVTATATYSYGIYATKGNITITDCEVEATAGVGISADIYINNGDNNGNVTIQNATVTATSEYYAIQSKGGGITIDGGQVTANGNYYYGIYAQNSNITLSWTNPTDYIYANSYQADGTITLTKTFKDEDGNTYSGTIAMENGTYPINGKTLYPEGVILKHITGYGDDENPGGYYLIASPVGTASPGHVTRMLDNEYDLYAFNQSEDMEWRNYKASSFDMVVGQGYLYANSEDVTLVFTGTPYSGDGTVTLTKTDGVEFAGWNLVGNPFNETAYIDKTDFYRMNAEGSEIVAATDNAIAPMEGIFVLAGEDGETVMFSTQEPSKKGAMIAIELCKGDVSALRPFDWPQGPQAQGPRTAVIDRAIVRFDEGRALPKFQIRNGNTKIYIPMDGTDYAVVSGRTTGFNELPVNFKAEHNGTYTLAFSTEGVTFGYLHLIDNMTGADVDLLAQNDRDAKHCVSTTYTFEGKTTDYASRFRLVFSVCGDANGDNETFAFINNGNIIITDADACDASLQVVDMTGRIIVCRDGVHTVSTSGFAPGVYVLRLINGDNIRTQKIVIR